MKKVKRWRYYCDFCKKSGGSGHHIEVHEKHCTNNPNRMCGMCRMAGNTPKPIKELVAALGIGDKEGMDNLRELCENCPACILAAIRQSGMMEPPDYDPEGRGSSAPLPVVEWPNFDFREEKKAFWQELKEDAAHKRDVEETFYAMGASYGDGIY